MLSFRTERVPSEGLRQHLPHPPPFPLRSRRLDATAEAPAPRPTAHSDGSHLRTVSDAAVRCAVTTCTATEAQAALAQGCPLLWTRADREVARVSVTASEVSTEKANTLLTQRMRLLDE